MKLHCVLFLFGVVCLAANAQSASQPVTNSGQTTPVVQPGQLADNPAPMTPEEKRRKAEEQIRQQEHQRILGILPEFNTSNVSDAVSLTPKQKFNLALKSVTDPAVIAFSGIDAAFSQWNNSYPGYGQGAQGYFKRFGAAYADSVDGTMMGNAIFPILLHQDPRYFRKGTGTIKRRMLYSISTTVICKGDNGHWQPNISNVAGNFVAGGISNLYYPSTDRGAELTVERALTVTAEGALGALFYEFWPDVSHHLFKNRNRQR